MRWKTKPRPRKGDRRTVIRFAFLPTNLDSHTTVWLERYSVLQHYVHDFNMYDDDIGWRDLLTSRLDTPRFRMDRESRCISVTFSVFSAIFLFFGYVVCSGSMSGVAQSFRVLGLSFALSSVVALLHAVLKGRRE